MDDASFLGSAINFGLWDAAGLMGLVFHRKKKGILLATVCVFTIHLVIYVWGGRNGWMAMDSVG